MDRTRFWLCVFAVFVLGRVVVSGVFFGVLFSNVFDEPSAAFRPEGQENFVPAIVGYVCWSACFVYLFDRSRRTHGWSDGIRFGLLVWSFYFVPMLLGIWSFFAVSNEWVASSLVSGLAESLAGGLIVAALYGSPPQRGVQAAHPVGSEQSSPRGPHEHAGRNSG